SVPAVHAGHCAAAGRYYSLKRKLHLKQWCCTSGLRPPFFISGSICVFFGVFPLFKGNESSLGAIGAGFALLIASMFRSFESFKFWGIEAKIRELKKVVGDAEDATLQLKDVAELTYEAIIRFNCSFGRYVRPMDMIELARVSENARATLAKLGTSESDIEKMLRPWVRTAALVAHKNVREALGEIIERHRIDLSKRKLLASPEELQSLVPRLNDLEIYVAKQAEKVQECAVVEIPLLITEMVNGSPEISLEDRNYCLNMAKKAAEEVRYLIENLEFKDRSYWESLRYQ
ncbi:hypothetical protein, partial [Paracidovorax oryzae]|uniref:hypothetical protein n=1 Tax=Paracidovorax oryzae TaxID=862720 RepID=UPI0035CEFE6D